MKIKTKLYEFLNTYNCIEVLLVLVRIYTSMIIGVIGNKTRAIFICFSKSQCKVFHNQNFIQKNIKIVSKSIDLLFNSELYQKLSLFS